ncbi:MAG: hypothetical protein ACI8RN_001460 [Glaciecola sp.]|jgi:hypothetical protein|uniref:hypothetical protein n=1 Tax=Congregibacter sp. TaxID=2744308 RepID=UPI0039E5431A
MLRAVMAFFPAVLGAYIVGSVFATQTILAELQAMAMPVTLRDRLHASWHDLLGLTTSYLPLILIAFLVAMPIAAGLSRYLPRARVFLYGLAGAIAILALHLIMKAVLGLNGIAAVREPLGLALQCLAGWFGGYLFYVFTGRAHR